MKKCPFCAEEIPPDDPSPIARFVEIAANWTAFAEGTY
jgi:hypothetical protein